MTDWKLLINSDELLYRDNMKGSNSEFVPVFWCVVGVDVCLLAGRARWVEPEMMRLLRVKKRGGAVSQA